MLSPASIAAVFVWTIAGLIGGGLFAFGSPMLEARFAPVLTKQKVKFDTEDRTPGRMCWTWTWIKKRYATPVVMSWSIVSDGTALEFPTVAQRERDGRVIANPSLVPLGKGRNDLCVLIPAELDHMPNLRVKGQINYRMPHGLWTVWQDLPTVVIPPLPAP